MWRCLCVFLCTSGFSALLPFCVRSAQNCAHSTNCGATRNYNPSICRPVPSDKGVTLADTLKRGSAKGSSETRHPRKGRNEIPHPVLLTGTRFRASVQSGSTKNINFWIFQRHAPTQRASVRLCTVFSCAGRVLSRGAGRTAYKGVQRAEMLRNVEVFKKYKKKGRRCRLPFVCCVLMLRVPQAVWKAAGAFPVLLPALRR